MKAKFGFLILAAMIFNSLICAQETRQLTRDDNKKSSQNRIALVIGNSRYQNVSTLDNPVNDANDMATELQGLGFSVIKGTDANLVQMRRLIREFGERLEAQKGIGLFFYAGHGVEVSGKNFLVPVDADITREVETEDYSIDVNSVLRQMDAANNGFNIVILDACRNNPFARGWNRSGDGGGLANVNAPTGTYIAYAAAPGTTASDGKGKRNGIFTGALLKNLKRPNLKLEEVFKATREEVMTLTGNKQVPWDSSSVKGDFYFNQTNSILPANSVVKVDIDSNLKSPSQQENEAWSLVKNATDPNELRVFLKEFPNGANSEKAKLKLEDLTWNSVKDSNDKSKVQAFLDEFENGVNAPLARIRLRQLENTIVQTNSLITNQIHQSSPIDDARGNLEKISVEQNAKKDGARGIKINVKFSVSGLKGVDLKLVARIQDEKGNFLTSTVPAFSNAAGELTVTFDMKPAFDPAIYTNLPLFVPYNVINLGSGVRNLKLDVDIHYKDGKLMKHLGSYDFVYSL